MPTEPSPDTNQPDAPALKPGNRREQLGWYFYDWANSAFSTTVGSVFLGPYVSNLADQAAGADGLVRLLGVPMAPYSFLSYCISISVILQVLFLPVLGAIADYSSLRKRLMQYFAVAGSWATMFMFFVTDQTWWLGGLLFIIANLCFGAAIVFYNAYLPDIADPEDRDRVSSVGWALGYLGGGLLLTLNLAFFLMRDTIRHRLQSCSANQPVFRRLLVVQLVFRYLEVVAFPGQGQSASSRRDISVNRSETAPGNLSRGCQVSTHGPLSDRLPAL